MKTFTKEQEAALSAFESAAESHDLHAFGNGRKHSAHAAVVARFEEQAANLLEQAKVARAALTVTPSC